MNTVTDPEATLRDMSLAERIAQLFVLGAPPGPEPPGPWLELVERWRPGGVALYAHNARDPEQVAGLTARLQALAGAPRPTGAGPDPDAPRPTGAGPHPGVAPPPGAAPGVPLLVALSQEGGEFSRLTGEAGFTHFPGALALGAAHARRHSLAAGRLTGAELRSVGINTCWAPVMDVLTPGGAPVMGSRCFGAAPGLVARLGMAYARGLADAGVVAVAKHFPGAGALPGDPHGGPVAVDAPRACLAGRELAPFRALVHQGVDALMTCHAAYPALDPAGVPATLSAPILNRLLRAELGFGGVVVADDLAMGAVRDLHESGELAARALLAGCDLLLVGPEPDFQQALLQGTLRAAQAGRLDQGCLDTACRRVLQLKARRRAGAPPDPAGAPGGTSGHNRTARAIGRHALTAVRGAGELPISLPAIVVSGEEAPPPALIEALHALSGEPEAIVAASASAAAQSISAAEDGPGAPAVSVILAATGDELAPLARTLLTQGHRVVLLLRRDPYPLAHYPPEVPALVCYDDSPAMLRAAAGALLGRLRPGGRLPVTLP